MAQFPNHHSVFSGFQHTLIEHTRPDIQTLICRPDSIVRFETQSLAHDSFSVSRLLFQYNSANQNVKTSEMVRENPNDAWSLNRVDSSAFNVQNIRIFREQRVKDLQGNLSVVDRLLDFPKASSTTRLDSSIVFADPFANGTLSQNNRTLVQYLPNDKVDVARFDGFDPVQGWVPFTKDTFSYNIDNQLIEVVTSEWTGSAWHPNRKSEFTYWANDSLGQILETDLTKNEPLSRFTIFYATVTNTTSFVGEIWDNTQATWIQVINGYNDYDAQGQLEESGYLYDLPGFFTSGERIFYQYESNNAHCLHTTILWTTSDAITYQKKETTKYYYSGSTAVHGVTQPEKAEFYPNPCTGSGLTLVSDSNAHLSLTDAMGRVHLQSELHSGTNEISTIGFPVGVYLLKITQPDGSLQFGKLIRAE